MDTNKDYSTIAKTPGDLVKILYLERWSYVIDAIEIYKKRETRNHKPPEDILSARLYSLFQCVQPALKRTMKEDAYKRLVDKVYSKKPEEFIQAFEIINAWFDKKGLTKIDTIQTYDRSRLEISNMMKGL
jgi:hypothetical protein